MTTLVLLLLILPLAGAVAAALLGPGRAAAVRWVSLAATTATLAAAVAVAAGFMSLPPHDGATKFQPEFVPGAAAVDPGGPPAHATTWNLVTVGQGTAIQFFIGVDGLNLWLVVLTALLMVPSVLVSWTSVTERDNEFFAWLLALEVAMIGVFLPSTSSCSTSSSS